VDHAISIVSYKKIERVVQQAKGDEAVRKSEAIVK
jgi:hypothetical protein